MSLPRRASPDPFSVGGLLTATADRPDPDTERLVEITSLLDLTALGATDGPGVIEALCARALAPLPTMPDITCAAVCVNPIHVARAAGLLAGTGVQIASVAGNFPLGQVRAEYKAAEAGAAVHDGATEIDLVVNRAAALAGDLELVRAEIAEVRAVIGGVTLKVILGTGELVSNALIERTARVAVEAGADFLKTSTGFARAGATAEATAILALVAAAHPGRLVGVKPSGGIRTPEMADRLAAIVALALGSPVTPRSFRIGASGLLDVIVARLAGDASVVTRARY